LAKITHRPKSYTGLRLDARVHCAVLKIRTETRLPRRIRAARVRVRSESAPCGCFLRTQQRARNSLRCLPSFRCPITENVLTEQSQESEPTSALILTHRNESSLTGNGKIRVLAASAPLESMDAGILVWYPTAPDAP